MAIGKTNYGRLRQRQGTVAELASANPVLAYGEFTMTYDGTDPVLKIGDGTRTWSALPNLYCADCGDGGGGGGGAYAAAETWSDAPMRSTGEGGINHTSQTWGTPYDPDGLADPSGWIEDGGGGELTLAEGWYHVAIALNVVFPPATAVTYCRMALNVGSSLAGNHEEIYAPAAATGGGAVSFAALMNLGPVYSDGTAYIRPDVRWTSGFYAPTTANLGVHVVKVS